MNTQWHNPENVSADKLPAGYRFLTKEEFENNTNGWADSGKESLWMWPEYTNGFSPGWSDLGPRLPDRGDTYCVPIAAMPAVGSYGRAYQQPGEVLVDAKELAELRDWFAGHALLGYMQSCSLHDDPHVWAPKMAEYAYNAADAMLAERAKGGAK